MIMTLQLYLSDHLSYGYTGHYNSAHCVTSYQEECVTEYEEICDARHQVDCHNTIDHGMVQAILH